jgi:CRISPR-associated protein Cas1
MRLKDLNTLPKVRDSFSYLYVEHCKIEQDAKAIAFFDKDGKTSVPCANLTTLLVGPGTTITHSAVKTLADNGCLVMWSGEGAVRFYAAGMGETRAARHLLRQAYLSSIPQLRLRVVRRMYEMRFGEELPQELTLQQIRGKEGVRVRTAYGQASQATGVKWSGRSYNRMDWKDSTPINRALSAANSCLYGVCQAGNCIRRVFDRARFIHTGKMLSFVYDIADLYKADLTIPLAFQVVAESEFDLESRIRHALRDKFHEQKFLQKIIPDLEAVLDVSTDDTEIEFDFDDAAPGGLWNGGDSSVGGGINWADFQRGGVNDGCIFNGKSSRFTARRNHALDD